MVAAWASRTAPRWIAAAMPSSVEGSSRHCITTGLMGMAGVAGVIGVIGVTGVTGGTGATGATGVVGADDFETSGDGSVGGTGGGKVGKSNSVSLCTSSDARSSCFSCASPRNSSGGTAEARAASSYLLVFRLLLRLELLLPVLLFDILLC